MCMGQSANRKDMLQALKGFFRDLWILAKPYWVSPDRWVGLTLLAAIIAMNLALVYVSVRLNGWRNDFYNSLQDKNYQAFLHQLLIFIVIVTPAVIISVYRLYLNQMLQIRWRQWLTNHFISRWLNDQNYYRLQIANSGTDNPDQRISEDAQLYVNQTLGLTLGFISNVVSLFSFVTILWALSGPLSFTVGALHLTIQGYMVWVALLYSGFGTWITHRIGWPLALLNFNQQKYEANFRFSLLRLRENSEGVALYKGEAQEASVFGQRFAQIIENWWSIMRRTKSLNWFTAAFGQAADIFPIIVISPRFFAGALPLGGLFQTSSAFGQVQGAMSWFIDAYTNLAEWKATVDRLVGFQAALGNPGPLQGGGITRGENDADALIIRDLDVDLPSGIPLLKGVSLEVGRGQSILISGPSGSGKSTLLRAISGIWLFGSGSISLPQGSKLMFLPQRPYVPLGTLKDALLYPQHGAGSESDARLVQVLSICGLAHLAARLDDVESWSLQLSPGEQQKLAFARAIIQRPDWLFLDEATSALDEPTEIALYQLVRSELTHTAIISVGHRASLNRFHERGVRLDRRPDGVNSLQEGDDGRRCLQIPTAAQ
jgi:vitamin B12/bleomycin/antimicrobial peptide transport system ATP-binding/permease protein